MKEDVRYAAPDYYPVLTKLPITEEDSEICQVAFCMDFGELFKHPTHWLAVRVIGCWKRCMGEVHFSQIYSSGTDWFCECIVQNIDV